MAIAYSEHPATGVRLRQLTQRAPAAPIVSLRSPFVLFMLAHMPLAVVMDLVPPVAGMHALITVAVGFKWAITGRDLERVAYVGAYIVGAEVLWRMTNPDLPWELGKYALSAVLLLALFRNRTLTAPKIPAIYFLLLLPSALITIEVMPFDQLRRELSFNLSGPLTLMVCAWFFSRIYFTAEKIQRLFLTLLAPCLGIASIAVYLIVTATEITFTTESNAALSGGFGPNQVSSALGLGIVVAFWAMLDERATRGLRLFLFACLAFVAVQAVLTYSRGGVYAALGAIAIGAPFLLADRRRRLPFLVFVIVAVVLGRFVVLPRLDAFTQGTLVERFNQTDPTERDDILLADLELWREYPVFGVGPGRAFQMRYRQVAAHTELSRLVAEHGTFGAVACALLLVGGVQSIRAVKSSRDRAIVTGLIVFSILFMLSAAMRLAAPSFTYGLAFLRWPTHRDSLAALARLRAAMAPPREAEEPQA
jgi:O-antigen ligase